MIFPVVPIIVHVNRELTDKVVSVGVLYLILDNTRYYRSQIVTKFQRNNPRIQLLFLPAYSPNLNIIK